MKTCQPINTAAVLAHMRAHKRHWKCAFLAEQLGITSRECRTHLDKLIATGEVSVEIMSDLRRRYVLTEQVPVRIESTATPPRYINVWTAPMRGYAASLAARAALAMQTRAA